MPTSRRYLRQAFYAASYEAQDVLVETADVDLIELEPGRTLSWRETLLRKLVWQDVSRTLGLANPGLHRARVTGEYDLFVAYCPSIRDLLHLNAVKGWQAHCRTSICVLCELWARDVPKAKSYLRALERFDHVVLQLHGSTQPVGEVLGRPCHYVPPAADALRFSPYPDMPPRAIDVYSLGRRLDAVHNQIKKMAAEENRFYVYDTLADGGDGVVRDHREHRELIAALAKRSRSFMVAAAKVNSPSETRGQIEIPNRYFEGAAAGAVLVGQRLDTDVFRRTFCWPDAIVEVRSDGSDARDVLSKLLRDPSRLQAISSRNAEEALLRHDWVHRWYQILSLAGFPATPGMEARMTRLRKLADLARQDRCPA